MRSVVDTNDTQLTLGNTEKISVKDGSYLNLDTTRCDEVRVYIDTGVTGTVPSEYTLTIEKYVREDVNDWMLENEYTTATDRSWAIAAPSNRIRVDLENTSGSSDSFRVALESIMVS